MMYLLLYFINTLIVYLFLTIKSDETLLRRLIISSLGFLIIPVLLIYTIYIINGNLFRATERYINENYI